MGICLGINPFDYLENVLHCVSTVGIRVSVSHASHCVSKQKAVGNLSIMHNDPTLSHLSGPVILHIFRSHPILHIFVRAKIPLLLVCILYGYKSCNFFVA